jgi:enoyl-CoA hydratase/carnithine racemase
LVNRVVEDDALEASAEEFAARLTSTLSLEKSARRHG